MIGYQDGRLFKRFSCPVYPFFMYKCGYMDQAFAGDMYQLAKYLFLIGFADRKQGHDSYQQAQEQASDKEQQEQAAGSCQSCQCIRRQPFGSGCCDEEPEKNGLQRVGYQYDGNHSQNGDEGNGLQCRMACEDQRTHTYHGGESGEEDGCLVRVQQLPSCAVSVLQSVHNENAEIIPDSKNKGGQNDVDDIEFNTQHAH